MSDLGGDEAVQETLAEQLSDAEPGEMAGGQTQGQIEHPHDGHTDSWSATKNEDGSTSFNKEHTPD